MSEIISRKINSFQFTHYTEELSYLVGVYLGDGSVYHHSKSNSKYFQLTVIDRDFAEEVLKSLHKVFGKEFTTIKEIYHKACKKVIYKISFSSISFCGWLENVTNFKNQIPKELLTGDNISRKFLEGIFDSEGWVSKSKKPFARYKRHRFEMGIAMTSSFLDQIASTFKLHGIRCTQRRIRNKPNRKPCICYRINLIDFCYSNFKIHIKRKQDRVDEYKKLLESSETEVLIKYKKNQNTADTYSSM